ncbi:M20 aminoacylase family protein [Microbulbifer sp. JMSA004]|uniref:M20 aminoacylase family protein n=1 Tax=unclassified Microbulbifer TaxID=2619833 RepID=UPI00403A98C0
MATVDHADILNYGNLVETAIRIRQDLHRHPEIAFEEVRTSEVVATRLAELGIEVNRGLGKTGVVGTLKGKRNGNRTVGLRADMDALFIEEKTGLPYQATVPGKMHACGHDGHTAMLLGAAEYLSQNPDFSGTVQFIFQPAEEGHGGAKVMIEDGLFDRFPCDAVYGMHNMPGIKIGNFEICEGPMMAAADTWEVILSGTGGHGAMPQKGTDPTMALAGFLSSVSTIVARNLAPTDSAVVSIGHVSAGDWGAPNIIPSKVVIRGTARSYTPEARDMLENRIGELAHSCAQAHRCEAELIYTRRYPPMVNHKREVDVAVKAARQTSSDATVDTEMTPLSGSEDFAFFLEMVPGAYICMGNGDSDDHHFLHTPLYDFDDRAIPHGVAYWVNVALEELGHD